MQHAEPLRAWMDRLGSARDRLINMEEAVRNVKSRQRSVHFHFAMSGYGLYSVQDDLCNAGNRRALPNGRPDNARDH